MNLELGLEIPNCMLETAFNLLATEKGLSQVFDFLHSQIADFVSFSFEYMLEHS